MTVYTVHASPLGDLLLTGETSADGFALTSVSMPGQRGAPSAGAGRRRDDAPFAGVTAQLAAYFTGRLTRFELPLAPGGTAFQRRVWKALDDIPYGTTTTYGALASLLGVPRAEIRAVGAAVGANPLLLVRPCHRLIGADGSMRGYAGGGERKVWLLTHEGALQPTLV
ncbi:methylated-DNA--[protein]-cysteine S-methyltransferase [Streptomyces brasiliensis]|uniref:methylated-DNA--[protein]-cysteine S-methyltransferase n=1 Tax=Streptomyces brasiliensis TaxID=1954 RepID=A0A917K183_9ACTN|nr:methylated-DNA--[protein]-cysteine S-methyltransferase [Streptomyces brasiliensis]GGI97036.1 methylated-DNA--protein-cysteine methyltransferase [Streptomyces brasiliensis]